MIDAPIKMVQMLQGTLGQTAFGGMLCFAHPEVNADSLYSMSTLMQLGQEIQSLDNAFGTDLLRTLPPKRAIGISPDDLHRSWVEFTRVIEGRSQTSGLFSANAYSGTDLFAETSSKLLSPAGRAEWITGLLKRINAPEIAITSSANWISSQGPVSLQLRTSLDKYFRARVANSENGLPTIQIEVPKSKKFIAKNKLEMLIAHAVALEAVSGHLGGPRMRELERLSEASIGTPLEFFNEVRLLRDLSNALETERFKKYRHLLPIESGFIAAYRPEVLADLANAIAEDDPNFGSTLLAISNRAGVCVDKRFRMAWSSFIDAIAGAGDKVETALVDKAVLASAAAKLDARNPLRREWLAKALEEMGVPAPDEILDSTIVKLNSREAIHVVIAECSGKNFSVSTRTQVSSNYLVVRISVPKGMKITDDEQIRFLVARALLMTASREFIPEIYHDKYKQISPDKLKEPVRLCVVNSGTFLRYGPIGASEQALRALGDEHLWLRAASAMINLASGGSGDVSINQESDSPSKRLWNAVALKKIKAYSRPWRELSSVPGASDVFTKHASFVRAHTFSFIFEIDEGLGDNIAISLRENAKLIVTARLSERSMSKMRPVHLAEIFVRALGTRLFSVGKGVYRERICRFDNLTDAEPEGLNRNLRLGRSLFMMAHGLKDVPETEPDGIEIDGNAGDEALTSFATTLEGVSRFHDITRFDSLKAAWSDVLSIKRWYINAISTNSDEKMVSVIPMNGIAFVHIEGDASEVSGLGWLLVMSAMAANPGQAIKVNHRTGTIALGERGDARVIYGSIAANRMFEAFSLFDPAAKMPERMSLRFPGDQQPETNPQYSSATMEDKQEYIRALRWFAAAAIPEKWKPCAGDDLATIKKKRREMSLEWHPDKNKDEVKSNLLKLSNTYWEAVYSMYGLKKNT